MSLPSYFDAETIRRMRAFTILQARFYKEGPFLCPIDDDAGLALNVAGHRILYVDDSSITSKPHAGVLLE